MGKSGDGGVLRAAGECGTSAEEQLADVARSRAGESGAISGQNTPRQGPRRRPNATRRHAETSAVGGDALVQGDSGGSGRTREQQELSDRRGTRRRPSTAELGRNLLRCGDGPSDTHRSAAAGAERDVDAKDPGEELHPRQPRGGGITQLSFEQGGGDGGQLELATRDEQRELLGLGLGLVGTRHDGTAQGVVGRQDAVVQHGVAPWSTIRRWCRAPWWWWAAGRTCHPMCPARSPRPRSLRPAERTDRPRPRWRGRQSGGHCHTWDLRSCSSR